MNAGRERSPTHAVSYMRERESCHSALSTRLPTAPPTTRHSDGTSKRRQEPVHARRPERQHRLVRQQRHYRTLTIKLMFSPHESLFFFILASPRSNFLITKKTNIQFYYYTNSHFFQNKVLNFLLSLIII